MIRYIRARGLRAHPRLADTMFRDRGAQFRDRLKWNVTIDGRGWELDAYDALDPLHVVWEERGVHGGSMRFLPTTGRTMVNDHFLHLTQGVRIASPHIWECTRFCLSPGAERRVAAALMLGGLEVGLRLGLSHAVGVFDAPMVRVYRALGWSPAVLGTEGGISVGLWAFEPGVRPRLLRKAGVTGAQSEDWAARDLPRAPPRRAG